MRNHFLSIGAIVLFFPAIVFGVTDVFDAEGLVIMILGKLGYFFWLLALLVFFWGLVKFINNAADTDEHEKGKHLMIWGIISFLVLVSLWAIVSFILVDTLTITAFPINYVDKTGAPL